MVFISWTSLPASREYGVLHLSIMGYRGMLVIAVSILIPMKISTAISVQDYYRVMHIIHRFSK